MNMIQEAAELVSHSTNRLLENTYRPMMHSLWMTMITGDQTWAMKNEEAERAYITFLANPNLREKIKSLLAADRNHLLPLQRRELNVLYNETLEYPREAEERDLILGKWNELHYLISTYRPKLEGRPMKEGELLHLLKVLRIGDRRKQVWRAYMSLGEHVAPKLIELVKLRNRFARTKGYANFYELKMASQEMDGHWLQSICSRLRQELDSSYLKLKERIDLGIMHQYGIRSNEIRPWHYQHPYLQFHEQDHSLNPSINWRKVQPKLTLYFKQRGVEVAPLINKAELSPQISKSQASFCLHLDRKGDIRISCHLGQDVKGYTVLMHELGHGIYEQNLGTGLSFVLRQPPHPFLSEAIALLMERITATPDGLTIFTNLSSYVEVPSLSERFTDNLLLKLYWTMTLMEFEKQLYHNPDQNLNKLWWEIVEEIQRVRRPDNVDYPCWAAKSHLSTLPVYYHNYLLGELAASQIQSTLTEAYGDWTSIEAITHLKTRLFTWGASKSWSELIVYCTGRELTEDDLIRLILSRNGLG